MSEPLRERLLAMECVQNNPRQKESHDLLPPDIEECKSLRFLLEALERPNGRPGRSAGHFGSSKD